LKQQQRHQQLIPEKMALHFGNSELLRKREGDVWRMVLGLV